jgi:putative peptidoglycan lipid II flippase
MSAAAADGDRAAVGRDLAWGLRRNAVAVVPAAAAFLALAPQLTGVVFQHGQTGEADARAMAWVLMAFAPGLPAYAAQYLLSRGFYAVGDTRTPFLLTLVIAGTHLALAVSAHLLLPARWVTVGLAAAYAAACTAGLACTVRVLRRRVGRWPGTGGTHLRLLAAAVPGAVAAHLAARWCTAELGTGLAGDAAGLALGVGVLGAAVLAAARPPLAVAEVAELTAPLRRAGRRAR